MRLCGTKFWESRITYARALITRIELKEKRYFVCSIDNVLLGRKKGHKNLNTHMISEFMLVSQLVGRIGCSINKVLARISPIMFKRTSGNLMLQKQWLSARIIGKSFTKLFDISVQTHMGLSKIVIRCVKMLPKENIYCKLGTIPVQIGLIQKIKCMPFDWICQYVSSNKRRNKYLRLKY